MPIYEYICAKCQKIEESFSSIKDRDKKRECNYCGNILVRKTSAPGHIIKGYCFKNEYTKK